MPGIIVLKFRPPHRLCCHSERSEESLILVLERRRLVLRSPSIALRSSSIRRPTANRGGNSSDSLTASSETRNRVTVSSSISIDFKRASLIEHPLDHQPANRQRTDCKRTNATLHRDRHPRNESSPYMLRLRFVLTIRLPSPLQELTSVSACRPVRPEFRRERNAQLRPPGLRCHPERSRGTCCFGERHKTNYFGSAGGASFVFTSSLFCKM